MATDTENTGGTQTASQPAEDGGSAAKSSGATSSRSRSRSRSSSKKSSSSRSGSSSKSSKATKSDSDTAARAELRNREGGPEGDQASRLQEQAKRQEAEQAAALKRGQEDGKPTAALSRASIAEQRTGQLGGKPLFGRVDNMTRRSDADAIEGHFVSIDLSNKDAKAAVESVIGEGNARFGSGDYGVYLEPAQVGEDGYPATILVQLRDEHAAFVTVPYEACRRAEAGRR